MTDRSERRYVGDGQRHYKPLKGAYVIPEPYIALSPLLKVSPLVEAVNAALYLRRPLLLEGEPGCGKTRLAYQLPMNWAILSILAIFARPVGHRIYSMNTMHCVGYITYKRAIGERENCKREEKLKMLVMR